MSTDISKKPNSSRDDREQLDRLVAKINAILPPQYVGCFEDVPSGSMGSASLKYQADGRVAWGEIWTTFCHLALAGGPPHRGALLEAITTAEAEAHPTELRGVRPEIERAIGLTTELPVVATADPAWIAVRCHDADMAAWLVRAIVAENVIARHKAEVLFLPVGPHFRLEKEIKNVVVCLAKTCHYLLDHVEPECRPRGLADSLVEPPLPDELTSSPAKYQSAADQLRQDIRQRTGLVAIESGSPGWIGIRCTSEEMAIWMLRAVMVEGVLARCEGNVLCVPVSRAEEPEHGAPKLIATVVQANQFWLVHTAGK
jgi:hypothetical protein